VLIFEIPFDRDRAWIVDQWSRRRPDARWNYADRFNGRSPRGGPIDAEHSPWLLSQAPCPLSLDPANVLTTADRNNA
jgi:hypothetical protein